MSRVVSVLLKGMAELDGWEELVRARIDRLRAKHEEPDAAVFDRLDVMTVEAKAINEHLINLSKLAEGTGYSIGAGGSLAQRVKLAVDVIESQRQKIALLTAERDTLALQNAGYKTAFLKLESIRRALFGLEPFFPQLRSSSAADARAEAVVALKEYRGV